MDYFTVSQINAYIKKVIDMDVVLSNIIVKGEISNYKKHYSGHSYFSIKDENSSLKTVMFKSYGDRIKFAPEDGMSVFITGKISVYERDGQYQLYAYDMQPEGIGSLNLAFNQLKEKLEKEGLFDIEKKKQLPKYPKKIGIVTSATGAALQDILNVSKRRYPLCQMVVYPSLVQGENAKYEIVKGIEYFNENKSVDIIITGRGGGSMEDLWAFNEEIVARAIYESEIPLISAVGHETDFTISDFVSDKRAPTPSAAAEIALPAVDAIFENINKMKNDINYKAKIYLSNLEDRITNYIISLSRLNIDKKLEDSLDKAKKLKKELQKNAIYILDRKKIDLDNSKKRLMALDPQNVLDRGYSILLRENIPVSSVNNIEVGMNYLIRLKDGTIKIKAEEIVMKESSNEWNEFWKENKNHWRHIK